MFIIIFLLFLLYYPIINIAQTNDYITPINNLEFSDSIVILNGSNNIFVETTNSKNRGITAFIDWAQVPEIGFPKDEIHTIKIIRRSKVTFDSNVILLSPNAWRFEADTWAFDYNGDIPYLENLEFLPTQDSANLTTSSKIELAQNPIGYYQDKASLSPGYYQAMNELSDHLVSAIFIISREENILMNKYVQELDEKIAQDILDKTNAMSKEELTNLIKEDELTNLKTESEVKNYVTNTTEVQSPKKTETVPVIEDRKTFKTSIDKKQQNMEK